jgi:hypothetical protein
MISADLSVLSAMITPAVLILATGSLLLTTSQRLSRSVDRARKLSVAIEQLAREPSETERGSFLLRQLVVAAHRSRLLQRAMVCLYLALGLFVGTSTTIGAIELLHASAGWVPIALGMAGAALLLIASGLLILESRAALQVVVEEMAWLRRSGEKIALELSQLA